MTSMDVIHPTGAPLAPPRSTATAVPQGGHGTLVGRAAIFVVTAVVATGIDLWTKTQPHPIVYHHYNHISLTRFVAVGLCLLAFALYRSPLLALAYGLYFGALCGNDGQLLAQGYATDWILVDLRPFTGIAMVTNIADICVLLGLTCLLGQLALTVRRRPHSSTPRYTVRITTLFALACGLVTGAVTRDLNVGLIVAILVDMEARVIVWVAATRRLAG